MLINDVHELSQSVAGGGGRLEMAVRSCLYCVMSEVGRNYFASCYTYSKNGGCDRLPNIMIEICCDLIFHVTISPDSIFVHTHRTYMLV